VKAPPLDPAARIELLEATRHYLEINSELAFDFVDRVETALQSVADQPRRFPRLETIQTEREIRRVLISRVGDCPCTSSARVLAGAEERIVNWRARVSVGRGTLIFADKR
jgi:plasmid stabilization system protein ParE